jgi:hypothetical protein
VFLSTNHAGSKKLFASARSVDTPLQDEPLLPGFDDVWTTSSLQS